MSLRAMSQFVSEPRLWATLLTVNFVACGSDAPLPPKSHASTPNADTEADDTSSSQSRTLDAQAEKDADAERIDAGALGDAGENEPLWEPCAEITDGEGNSAECIQVNMPMLRNAQGEAIPESPEISIFFKRLPARTAVRAQLWLLQGGPGYPGVGLEPLAAFIQERHPDLEIYIPDHRGTGRSTWFECAEIVGSEEDYADPTQYFLDCGAEVVAEWGDDLSMMRVTEAAYDVTTMMRRTMLDGVPIYAHGASYGGYWLHRVLQVGGDLVDSAIFDSALHPLGGLSDMDTMLAGAEAGAALFEACALDDECSAHLGETPLARGLQILDNGGDCVGIVRAGFDRILLQYALTNALEQRRLLGLIPAVLYRLERCEPEDVSFIEAFADEVLRKRDLSFASAPSAPSSLALNATINLSEIYQNASDRDALFEVGSVELFANLGSVLTTFDGFSKWPRYTPDVWNGQWASTTPNVLILHGSFDAVTPPQFGRDLAEHYSKANHYYFELPHARHGAARTSHDFDGDISCGTHIMDQFLDDPERAPDASCIAAAPAFEFGSDEETLLALLGHTDVWDNPVVPPARP